MESRRGLCWLLTVALLGQALAVPLEAAVLRRRRYAESEIVDDKNTQFLNFDLKGDGMPKIYEPSDDIPVRIAADILRQNSPALDVVPRSFNPHYSGRNAQERLDEDEDNVVPASSNTRPARVAADVKVSRTSTIQTTHGPKRVARAPRNMIENSTDSSPTTETVTTRDEDTSSAESVTSSSKVDQTTPNDSEEDDDIPAPPPPGGSNIFSLLRLANAFFPTSSGAAVLRNIIRRYLNSQVSPTSPFLPVGFNNGLNLNPTLLRRQDVSENLIHVDEIKGLKPPPFQRQETEEDDDESDGESEESDENNAAEESLEDGNEDNGNGNENASKQKEGSNEKASDENESDFSDEPEGDGMGGGILGILASLSGGEDGQSDLGSLLATVSGIVANLSGDGIDINALIASGLGLFVGLLSEGEENPGAVIASYLLTSLDTITGGGSKNNGAFFGTFLSKLIRGTSAGGDPDASSEEGKEPEKDSAGFIKSFLMALLGEMSKGSSGGSSSSSSHQPPGEWR